MLAVNSQKTDSRNKGIQSVDFTEFLNSHDHVVTYLCAILEDCFNINPLYGHTDYLRDRETLIRRFSCEGLVFATKTLPGFFDSILSYLETGSSAYPSFRLKHGCTYPVFLQQLVAPIYTDYTSDDAGLSMKLLYQLCAAFGKLKGPFKQSVLVKQLDEFVETDGGFNMSNLSEQDYLVLEKARVIIKQVLEGLNPFDPAQSEQFLPRPGPGSTNHPIKKYLRYQPHVLYAQLADTFDYDEWFCSRPFNYMGNKAILLDGCLQPENENSKPLKKSGLLTSRFKFVHKRYGKPRCICIEEFETQWLQQALRRAMYDQIEHHPLTKGYVNFTDQSINGLLALRSSHISSRRAGFFRLTTMDMKEGSDRVFRDLVEFLYQDNKELLQALLSLSTRIIELPKDVPYHRKYLFAKKFAPMGSAICFPIMGLTHFALVKSIISCEQGTPHINDIPVWVYGDDIIYDSKYTSAIYEQLPHFGMKINVGKSYAKSLFRESCGVHAYNGMDITPTRFKTIVSQPLSVNKIATALSDEGALYKKGFICTAKLIRNDLHKFKEVRANSFHVVGPKSSVVGWIRDDKTAQLNCDFKPRWRRWSNELQRFRYKARVFVDKLDKDVPPIDESCYYLRKQVERTEPFAARQISGSSIGGLSLQWKWLPDSAFYHA